MGDFKQLTVWQRSREVAREAHHATSGIPSSEGWMASQIRRAAVSVSANIAEGSARHSGRDQARFYRIALASAREVEALLVALRDLEWLAEQPHVVISSKLDEVQRMLVGLIRSCVRRPRPGQ